MKTGAELIAEERARQIAVEGWTPTHDDVDHSNGELAAAAAFYAIPPHRRMTRGRPSLWPKGWRFKPTPNDRIRELVKAGALIVAEIERLKRAGAR